jgi:hypothetical protein
MKTRQEFEQRWPNIMPSTHGMFSCPEGWTDRVWVLLEDIDAAYDHELNSGDTGFKVSQVKEKFGGLRFYYYGAGKENPAGIVEKLVEKATADCWDLCLSCGTDENVSTKGPGWVSTQCDPCRANRELARTPRG